MPSNNNRRNKEYDNEQTRKYRPQSKKRKTAKRVANNEPTKRVPTGKRPVPKKGNSKKGKKDKFSAQHPKFMMFIKIMIILFLLLCVIGAGVVVGIFFGLFGDDFEITKEELQVGASNSVIVDANGAVIANLSGDEKRKVITLEDMSEYLPKAYVAIEDERFYEHSGVDLKRTAGAILNTVFRGNSSYGGSTITQQLVKNITDDDESEGLAGIFRKVREWAKAYQVERMISKNQILELYLNILFVGGEGNLHGVELGAEYYFNKSAKDLTLAECAFMAGINTSPMSYNPFDESQDNTEKIKNRTKTVLDKMLELGDINSDEYNTAVAEVDTGLNFQKGDVTTSSNYSYHTDAVLEQVINQVMEERGVSRQIAENYVYSSGLTIYSTVDASIQARIEEEYQNEKYIKSGRDKDSAGNLVNDHTQSGMAIIDYRTGNVVAVAGGLGEKEASEWNRATQMKKQTGSSIKMIADVVPALEEGVITPATVYWDEKTDFGGNYTPKNDGDKYKNEGSNNEPMNIREFIRLSRNIPAVKIMKELTPKKSIEYLQQMGLSSLDEQDENLALAIGGLTHGASPLEMAAAYGTIANDGVYITPTFYTKVVDSSGNTVLTPKQEQTRVFSEQTAYLAKQIGMEPTKSGGTATYCAIKGMDVVAKTGTTDDSYDRWLCGFTQYYAAATWFGFDNNEEVRGFSTNPAGQIWDAVMTDIHQGLESASFEKPSGIVEQTVCRVTGCLATTGCTNTYKEVFASNKLPETCQGHGSQQICSESGKVATQYCSQYCTVTTNYYGAVLPKEQLNLWKSINNSRRSNNGTKVNEVCTLHTTPKQEETPPETTNTTSNNSNIGNAITSNTNNTSNTSNTSNTNNTDNTTNVTPPSDTTNTSDNTTNTN